MALPLVTDETSADAGTTDPSAGGPTEANGRQAAPPPGGCGDNEFKDRRKEVQGPGKQLRCFPRQQKGRVCSHRKA